MTSTEQTATTVRKFSAAGPCILLGTVIRETANTWTVERTLDGQVRRLGKNDHRHTEPCERCGDHSSTTHPHGYAD